MSLYILVREDRVGRQSETDIVHCFPKGEDKTVCGDFKRERICCVANIGSLIGDSPICQDCKSKISESL